MVGCLSNKLSTKADSCQDPRFTPERREKKLVAGSVYEKPPLYCAELGSCTGESQGLRAAYSQSRRANAFSPASVKSYCGPMAMFHGGFVPGAKSMAASPAMASPAIAKLFFEVLLKRAFV